jgi:transcriptional regulator with XRE-family HTH domain
VSGVLFDGVEVGREGLGQRLRAARARRGMTLRELARRIGISPSLVSQIETGKAQPSVKTLYAITTELGVSLDAMFVADGSPGAADQSASAPPGTGVRRRPGAGARAVRAGEGRILELGSGVRWERLEAWDELEIEVRRTTYQPGSSSSPDGTFLRHSGREFGMVLSGVLTIKVGFDDFVLEAGDSISFDSTLPHLLRNDGTETAHAIWFEVGRHGSVD